MSCMGAGKPNVVCMPLPAQGHIKAMLKLAKLLHFRGFHITFVHTESNYNKILATSGPASLDGSNDFRFQTIPDAHPTDGEPEAASLFTAIRDIFADPFRTPLKRLHEPLLGMPPVTGIISDSFTSFTLGIEVELGVPDVFFCFINACAYTCMIQFEQSVKRGLMPLKSESDLGNGYLGYFD